MLCEIDQTMIMQQSKQVKSFHMMATKAYHTMGDISRTEPDLIIVRREHDDYYIGNWVEGFGFINVIFPKETTRDLNAEEFAKYHGQNLVMGPVFLGKQEIISRPR